MSCGSAESLGARLYGWCVCVCLGVICSVQRLLHSLWAQSSKRRHTATTTAAGRSCARRLLLVDVRGLHGRHRGGGARHHGPGVDLRRQGVRVPVPREVTHRSAGWRRRGAPCACRSAVAPSAVVAHRPMCQWARLWGLTRRGKIWRRSRHPSGSDGRRFESGSGRYDLGARPHLFARAGE